MSSNTHSEAIATMQSLARRMSAYGYKRKFWGPLISVRFTPENRHTEAQCPLLGLPDGLAGRMERLKPTPRRGRERNVSYTTPG